MKRFYLIVSIMLLSLLVLTGCSNNSTTSTDTSSSENKTTTSSSDTDETINVILEVNDGKQVEIELYPDVAPKTVENFVNLVNSGFYDGLTFHRVIDGFMIQGGDPTGTGMGGSDETIVGEFESNGIENDLSHVRGVISMARSNDPDSASSQFFIVTDDSTYLDGNYAAFGKVISGMEEIDKIVSTETDANDRPIETQTIEKIYVVD